MRHGLLGDLERLVRTEREAADQATKLKDRLDEQLREKANRDIKENRGYGDVRNNRRKLEADIQKVLDPAFRDIDVTGVTAESAIDRKDKITFNPDQYA